MLENSSHHWPAQESHQIVIFPRSKALQSECNTLSTQIDCGRKIHGYYAGIDGIRSDAFSTSLSSRQAGWGGQCGMIVWVKVVFHK
jgi:hypothetical protein